MNTTPFRSTVVVMALMAVAVAISRKPTSAFCPLTSSSSQARFYSYTTTTNHARSVSLRQRLGILNMAAEGNEDSSSSLSQGVLELADDDDEEEAVPGSSSSSSSSSSGAVAPFLSQGEISEEAMEMDWKDPKQARVMFYIILSLIPVLFLIPLMLGSRDLIPIDALPPVEMN